MPYRGQFPGLLKVWFLTVLLLRPLNVLRRGRYLLMRFVYERIPVLSLPLVHVHEHLLSIQPVNFDEDVMLPYAWVCIGPVIPPRVFFFSE